MNYDWLIAKLSSCVLFGAEQQNSIAKKKDSSIKKNRRNRVAHVACQLELNLYESLY